LLDVKNLRTEFRPRRRLFDLLSDLREPVLHLPSS